MADGNGHRRLGFGFGVIGNAKACRLQHRDVVCAVANGKHLPARGAEGLAVLVEQIGFGLRINHAAQHLARELAIHNFKLVGKRPIQPQAGFQAALAAERRDGAAIVQSPIRLAWRVR